MPKTANRNPSPLNPNSKTPSSLSTQNAILKSKHDPNTYIQNPRTWIRKRNAAHDGSKSGKRTQAIRCGSVVVDIYSSVQNVHRRAVERCCAQEGNFTHRNKRAHEHVFGKSRALQVRVCVAWRAVVSRILELQKTDVVRHSINILCAWDQRCFEPSRRRFFYWGWPHCRGWVWDLGFQFRAWGLGFGLGLKGLGFGLKRSGLFWFAVWGVWLSVPANSASKTGAREKASTTLSIAVAE